VLEIWGYYPEQKEIIECALVQRSVYPKYIPQYAQRF